MKTDKVTGETKLVLPIEYDGKFTVSYNLDDGRCSAFRVVPELGLLIVKAVNMHQELVDFVKHFADGKLHDGLEMTKRARRLIALAEKP